MSIVSGGARVGAAAFVMGLSSAGPQAPGVATDDLILLRELMRQRRKHLAQVIKDVGHRP